MCQDTRGTGCTSVPWHQQDRGPVPGATVSPQRNYGPGMMTTVIMHGPGNRLPYPRDAFNINKSNTTTNDGGFGS